MYGRRHTDEIKQKLRQLMLGKKHRLGKKCSPETIIKMQIAKACEKHPFWKGDQVGYHALHEWVGKRLPKPETCSHCKQKKKLDLANITGIYNRDFKNWKYLCRRCHLTFDKIGAKGWATRRSKKQ